MFNADEFLNQQLDKANDTKLLPVPEGDYLAIVDDIKARQWIKKDDPTVCGVALDVVWSIDDQNLKEELGREKITVKQGIMLETTEEGQLDFGKGKNVGLGKLREALDLNEPGQPFSFPMMKGRVAKIKVTQRIDGDNIYNDVKMVAKLQ